MPPNGKSALTPTAAATETERVHLDGDISGEIPRRVLAKDGLHVGLDRARHSEPPPPEDRSVMALVSSARHELRAPLQSIQGFAELLASEAYGPLGADQRVFIDHIVQGSADLSRTLDACFELLTAELLHLPAEPLRAPLRPLLDESLVMARKAGQLRVDAQLETLSDAVEVDVDLHDFSKAVSAIITALTPLVRNELIVRVSTSEERAEVIFATHVGETRFRSLHDVPRKGLSARALLWLRLASALFARSNGQLETSDGYDQVRITLQRPASDTRAAALREA
ncbi:MAG TPA: histidine kinase dimerization/phospho-acceptor domain-containing protein [Polyangiales bacterium]